MDGLVRKTLLMLGFIAAVGVGNIWANQPILEVIARAFGAPAEAAGQVATLTGLGYAIGILLFVPLGDVVERKRLVAFLSLGTLLALAASATAQSLPVLLVSSFFVGCFSVMAHVLLPLVADLADPEHRGQIVGSVQSGMITGALFARVIAGFVAAAYGWRSVFMLSFIVSAAAAFLIRWVPAVPPRPHIGYLQLQASLWSLFRREPALRLSTLLGACGMGTFACYWTVLPFRLAMPPYEMGSVAVGLLALTAIAGAASVSRLGAVADRRGPIVTNWLACAVYVVAFACAWAGDRNFLFIIPATLGCSFAVQTNQISNLTRVFTLDASARSRLVTMYMFLGLCGNAAGAFVGILAWQYAGWTGVCLAGFAITALSAGTLLRAALVSSRARAASQTSVVRL